MVEFILGMIVGAAIEFTAAVLLISAANSFINKMDGGGEDEE